MYSISKSAFIKLFVLMTVLVAAGYLLVYQVALKKVDEKIKNQPNKGGSVSISITDLQKDFVSLQQGTGSPQTGNINITGNIQASGSVQGSSVNTDSLNIGSLNGILKADQGVVSGGATTSDVTEGATNKYYTDERVDNRLSSKTTNNIIEGTNNLYYTGDRFNQSLDSKTTDNLTEGTTNKYYTDPRAREAISGSSSINYNSTTGSISLNNSGVTSGTYGDGTHVGQFTVDAQGRVTSSADVLITGAAPVGVAGGDLTGNFPNPTISNSWGGVTGINTLGTINTGTWHGTAIQDAYIATSANWNTAYSERNQWDGGATGLNALTGRASLGLGSVENTALSTWGGTSNINTIGNVTSGTVNGQTISSSSNFTGTITAAGTINGATISGGTLTASAVNGVTTGNIIVNSGSYADPAWISSLAKSKVGLGSVDNVSLLGWTGSANLATVGTITSGTWNAGAVTSSGAIQGTSLNVGAGTITSGTINGQTISSSANFTGTVTVATSVSTPSITNSGSDISFNSKNLTSVGTIASGAITSSGAIQGTSLNVGSGTISSGNININTNGTSALFSTYRGANSYGDNIFIGGGGQSSVGAVGETYKGSNNAAMGLSALYSNTTGHDNIANGTGALFNNTTGSNNTANGVYALVNNTTGYNNTANGMYAFFNNTTGYNNTGVGVDAGFLNQTGNGNVFLGYQAGYNETGSNKLYIANSNTATPLIYGDFSTGELTFNGGITVTGAAQFNGTLTVTGAATFNGTLTVNKHVITGNATGSTTIAVGANAGTGATVSITGNDTSGTITVTTGTGPAAGVLATVTFASAYGAAPKVVLTPSGNNGATLQYNYSSATTTFTLNSGNAPTASTAYTYSYHVMQ